jgi:hypothetical protein
VIPALTEVAETLGVNATLVALVFAGLITSLVLLAQSVIGWFEDRNP